MSVNYIAVFIAAIASWIAGAVWYGVLGKQWMAALEWTDGDSQRKMPVGPMIISFIAELIMAFMLAGLIRDLGPTGLRTGIITGLACWFAFVATTIAVNNAFQKRKPALTLIDSGHWLVVLLVQGIVLGLFS